MPKITLNKRVFVVRWRPEWNNILWDVAKRFKRGRIIDWKGAEREGALKGLPDLSLQAFSKRITNLKRYNRPDVVRQRKEYSRTHPQKARPDDRIKRLEVFWGVPNKVREQAAYKSRNNPEWTPERKKLLIALVKFHRRSPTTINWDALVKDSRARFLPRYSKTRLRSYYWSLVTRDIPKVRRKRRKDALAYKRKNHKKFLANQDRRIKIIRKVVRDTLLAKIPLRK